MKRLVLLLILPLLLLLSNCEIINPEEEIPAYIHIDSYELQTHYATEGSAAHNITDVWVLAGPDIIGVFELPATIPVLKSGPTTITVRPGILLNGISNTRNMYPYYSSHAINRNLQPAVTDTIKPVTEYLEETIFPIIDDFEGLTSRFDTSSLSKAGYEFTTNPAEVFEGNQSFKISLNSTQNSFELVTKNSHLLPRNKPIFAELNYKTNSVIYVGFVVTGNNMYHKEAVVGINPSTEWKKIYINLSQVVTALPAGLNYRVFIAGELDAGNNSSTILLDNFKLLHLE